MMNRYRELFRQLQAIVKVSRGRQAEAMEYFQTRVKEQAMIRLEQNKVQ